MGTMYTMSSDRGWVLNYLAVDVGGTSTRAVIVAGDGRCIGYGAAGRGNPTSSGPTQAASAIVSASNSALAQAGLAPSDLTAAVAGMAGANTRSDDWLGGELARAGLPEHVSIQSDVLATYCSGSLAADGYAMVAGTGSVAARIRGSRIDATGDGLGWLLGDGGSGFWIGRRVVRTAIGALDGRRPSTALVDMVLAELDVESVAERGRDGRLVSLRRASDALYQLHPVEVARFARLAFDAAAMGDDTARQIVEDASAALAATISTVAEPGVSGPLVLGGSILSQQPSMAARVVQALRKAGVDGPVTTVPDGTAGAAVLALRQGGVTVDDAVFGRIQSSLAALR